MCGASIADEKPEFSLAKVFKDELNVEINPQALRMFIRSKWNRISTLSHAIHDNGVKCGEPMKPPSYSPDPYGPVEGKC